LELEKGAPGADLLTVLIVSDLSCIFLQI